MRIINNYMSYLFIFLSINQIPHSIAGADVYDYLDEINRKIESNDCAGAEIYTKSFVKPPVSYTALGLIYLDCFKNEKVGIEYLKIAAYQNETLAIEKLISLGEKPPKIDKKTDYKINDREYQLPPMPERSNSVSQQQVIIQHKQYLPSSNNLNACLQDGGALFCPNHPNTKITPFKF